MSSLPAGAPKRRGLGRGLDALLGGERTAGSEFGDGIPQGGPGDGVTTDVARDDGLSARGAPVTARLVDVDPRRVTPNPEQPRTTFDPEELQVLTESVRTHGVLQPIVVEVAADGTHQLVAGERRLRAARAAGLSTVPAIVRPAAESARQALELALTENLVRADLSALEEAGAYSRLADAFGLSHEAIALRVGRSRAAVSNTVRLLTLPASVQTALAEGRITAGHARALLALTTPAAQERLALRAETEHLSVRDVERAAQDNSEGQEASSSEVPARPAPRGSAALTPDEAALRRGFETAVGAPVKLERRRRGGRLVIEFYNDDELHGLYQRLGGPEL